jgi:hypothetical protein
MSQKIDYAPQLGEISGTRRATAGQIVVESSAAHMRRFLRCETDKFANSRTIGPDVLSALMSTSDLETRVQARKADLIAEIIEHKKNSSRYGSAEAIDRIKGRLAELAHIVKDGPANDSRTAVRFNEWLAR